MKKIFLSISFLSVLLMMFVTSCEKEEILYEGKVVYFEEATQSVFENDATPFPIRIVVAGTEDAGGTDVTVEISTEGIDNPAIEGTDFDVDKKTFSFSKHYGIDSLMVTTSDNLVYEKDKFFDIVITSTTNGYVTATKDTIRVTVADNEHPLALVIGTYSTTATSYFNGGQIWDIVTSPDPSDETHLLIDNFVANGSNLTIYGIVNFDDMTLKIPVGQNIVDDASNPAQIMGFYGPDGATAIPDGGFITGNIDASGNISIADEFGARIYEGGNTGYWFNVFQADGVMTKSKKKSTERFSNISKPKKLNK